MAQNTLNGMDLLSTKVKKLLPSAIFAIDGIDKGSQFVSIHALKI